MEFSFLCILIEKIMKTIYSILMAISFCSSLQSQTITLNNATSQGWAGGMCCATGTRYQISITVDSTDKKFRLDTLWIGQQFFALDKTDGYTVIANHTDGKSAYTINVGISSNHYREDDIDLKKEIISIVKAPIYTGEACLVYHTNKMRKQFEIKEFKELPYLAYP
jgi:hypothetical protein